MPTHLLGHERVAHEIGTQPAGLFGHAQAQEPRIGQIGPVLMREAGIAVVGGRTLGKRRPQLGHLGHKLGSLGRQHLFIHHSPCLAWQFMSQLIEAHPATVGSGGP